LTQGLTSVIASVYGPVTVKKRQELLDRATVKVTYKPLHGQASPVDTRRGEFVRCALEACILTRLYRARRSASCCR
jgi:hypothetical protein